MRMLRNLEAMALFLQVLLNCRRKAGSARERFPFSQSSNHPEPPKGKEKRKKPKKAVPDVVLSTGASQKAPQNKWVGYIDGRPAAPIRAAGP